MKASLLVYTFYITSTAVSVSRYNVCIKVCVSITRHGVALVCPLASILMTPGPVSAVCPPPAQLAAFLPALHIWCDFYATAFLGVQMLLGTGASSGEFTSSSTLHVSLHPSAAFIICILSPTASCCCLQLAFRILIRICGNVWSFIEPAVAGGVLMAPAGTCLLAVLSGGPNSMPRTLKQSPLLAAGVLDVLGSPQGSRFEATAQGCALAPWAVSRQWWRCENIYGS